MSPERKTSIAAISGLVISAVTAIVIIGMISFLLHWKQDMSIVDGGSLANAGGTLGYKAGRLLISRLFGLASIMVPIMLVAVSLRLLFQMWKPSLTRTALLTASGMFIFSVVLSWAGCLVGLDCAFESGLGGQCGAFLYSRLNVLLGEAGTPVVLAVVVLCWLFFCSSRFAKWLSSLGAKKFPEKDGEEESVEPANDEENPVDDAAFDEVIDVAADMGEVFEKPLDVLEVNPDTEALPEQGSTPTPAEDDFDIIGGGILPTEGKELKPIDNRLDPPDGLPSYRFPSLDLLDSYSDSTREVTREELVRNNNKIRTALANYKIQVDDVKAVVGPTVTLYKVYPSAGVKIAEIKKLQEDIAMSLKAKGVRVVNLDDSVGIEVANDFSSIVPLKALLNDDAYRTSKAELPVAIGYTITQKVKVFDLADAPHLLVAGATKQGKSVGLNVIVSSLLYAKHPSELRFVFIDPKMVEFSAYSQLLHHYLAVLPDACSEEDEMAGAIVKKAKVAEKILRSLCIEMDERYELLSAAGVNKVTLYNEKFKKHHLRPDKGHRYLPYLVVVVDEYADLTMTVGAGSETKAAGRSITNSIVRLAQKGRAAGLHVILATQRPSVDVISGLIKSNFPMRIAFRVASKIDSMTILDAPGAEKLIGKGDMLFSAGIDSERIQCGYVSGEEIEAITDFIGAQKGYGKSYNTPYYLPAADDSSSEEGGGAADMSDVDERFSDAATLVVTTQKASTSYLQTRLGMGFAKAARVMGQLEAAGIVGPQEGSKTRQVLVPDLDSLRPILDSFVK